MRKGIANDPHRKTRIAQGALDVMAEEGVRGATHRTIAARAGVPLGSVTYHFGSIEDILVAAFTLLGKQVEPRYQTAIRNARTSEDARRVVVAAVCGETRATEREMRLTREMNAYGSVCERVGDLIREGERSSIEALAIHFPEPAARAIDALVEGLWAYQSWTPGQLDERIVAQAIDGIVTAFTAGAASELASPIKAPTR